MSNTKEMTSQSTKIGDFKVEMVVGAIWAVFFVCMAISCVFTTPMLALATQNM